MLLLEHNGKALFRKYQVPTPAGTVVRDENALAWTVTTMPPRLVLKAQIAGGGRSKGGGIAFVGGASEAREAFAALLGSHIDGHFVDAVLVEERIAFARERYAGILIDGGEIRLLFARIGGVDIEEITAADPANLASIAVDPIEGPATGQLRDCFERLGYALEYWPAYERTGRALFSMFRACDATMIEINPLVELANGQLLALDARIAIDDTALERQPEIAAMQPRPDVASRAPGAFAGLRFRENPQGGSIGPIGLGGGLNVTLMDWIARSGSQVETLVDIDEAIGSGHTEQGFAMALEAFDRNPSIRAVLVNIITCGYRLDDIVAALLPTLDRRDGRHAKPTILHLRGNCMARTPHMLAAAGRINSPSIAAAIDAVTTSARA